MILSAWALRCLGISGILGAILFMLGDLSYNHIPGSGDSPAVKMSIHPERRLLRAGIFGLPGCWLYVLAALHLYLAFRPVGDVFAFLLALAFGATMISYGIAHAAYFSIAAGARAAVKLGGDAETGGQLGNTFFNRVVLIVYVPVVIFNGMMIYGILTGGSLYPWWMVLCLPLVFFLLKTPVLWLLRGRLRELVNDCYDNLILFVFFTLSTLVLWNGWVG